MRVGYEEDECVQIVEEEETATPAGGIHKRWWSQNLEKQLFVSQNL